MTARPNIPESAAKGLGLLCLLLLGLFAATLCGGCVSEYTGSRVTVGEQLALPEISDSSDSVKVRVYESVKGAKVWTARDSRVRVAYRNAYTNSYFGIVTSRDSMHLEVEVEPLEVTPVSNRADGAD